MSKQEKTRLIKQLLLLLFSSIALLLLPLGIGWFKVSYNSDILFQADFARNLLHKAD